MRKTISICTCMLLISSLTAICHAGTKRAVSLRVLESVIKSGGSKDAEKLCGITKIGGYFTDGKTHDIILFGEVDPSYPALHLDDFIVALRSVNMAYAQKRGHTYWYSPPGCSIDPDPKVLQDLRRVSRGDLAVDDQAARKQRLDNWIAVGSRPQNVRVMGVPFNSRFGRVMVEADYYMKRLVNGSVNLGISGFESLLDMDINQSKDAMRAGKSVPPSSSMNRFWFCPGETSFEEDAGVVTLRNCRVKLLTEAEFLTESGQLTGRGRPDPLAHRFAQNFSARYDAIGAARPIYKELQGLFRFVAIAKLMRDEKAYGMSGTTLLYLNKGCRTAFVPVPRTLAGLTNSREMNEQQDTSNGRFEMRGMYMSCGGVSMDVRPRRIRSTGAVKTVKVTKTVRVASSNGKTPAPVKVVTKTVRVRTKPAAKLKNDALKARKSPKSLYWDFPGSS